MATNADRARKVFREHGSLLRSSEAQKLGVHPQTLSRMVDAGQLVKEERGLYRLAERQLLVEPDLIQVAKLIPKAVICLITALSYHRVTTQIPRSVWIALPREQKPPKLDHPPIEVIYLSSRPYSSGIDHHKIDGISVPIYSLEKTIADCFKFRGRIGEDIALEALKDYLRRSDRNMDRLMECAKVDRVQQVMEPYLKALI